MSRIAIIGAGGFVGARFLEQSVLRGGLEVVPIVRSWRSQGRLARFGFLCRMGDAAKPESLTAALSGCRVAINLTMGDNSRIAGDVASIHAACQQAGVQTFIHLSSAEVFGQADSPGLTEDSSPKTDHWMEYARAKAEAENWLRSRADGNPKVVVLRPGLIWGPGSGWLAGPAQSLAEGTAFVFNDGKGICNLIHVDNLIAHLVMLAEAPIVAPGFYNVADRETLTWLDFYSAVAKELGIDPATIHRLPESAYRDSLLGRLKGLGQTGLARNIKRRMSGAQKIRIKQWLKDTVSPPPADPQPHRPTPQVTKDAWWLQGTRSKLPTAKFAAIYGEPPLQSFEDSMRAAAEWLRFAGFGQQPPPA